LDPSGRRFGGSGVLIFSACFVFWRDKIKIGGGDDPSAKKRELAAEEQYFRSLPTGAKARQQRYLLCRRIKREVRGENRFTLSNSRERQTPVKWVRGKRGGSAKKIFRKARSRGTLTKKLTGRKRVTTGVKDWALRVGKTREKDHNTIITSRKKRQRWGNFLE